MKKIVTVLVFSFALLSACSDKNNQESADVKNALTTQSAELDKTLIESWGEQQEFFIKSNFEIIEWDEAKRLLLGNTARDGNQYRTAWLTIYTSDDKKYLVKQPELNALWKYAEERDFGVEGFEAE